MAHFWPIISAAVTTLAALAAGHLLGGPSAEIRHAVAIAGAMRNVGLALLVATTNQTPPGGGGDHPYQLCGHCGDHRFSLHFLVDQSLNLREALEKAQQLVVDKACARTRPMGLSQTALVEHAALPISAEYQGRLYRDSEKTSDPSAAQGA